MAPPKNNTQNESINLNDMRNNQRKKIIRETIKKVLSEGDVDGMVKKTGVTFTPSDAQQAALEIIQNAEREEKAKTDEKFNFGWYKNRFDKPMIKLLNRFNKVFKPKIDLIQDQTGRYDKQVQKNPYSYPDRKVRFFKIHYDIDVDDKGITVTRNLSGDINYTCVYRLMPDDPNNDIYFLPKQLKADKMLIEYAQDLSREHYFCNITPYKIFKESKNKINNMKKIRLTESYLHNIIKKTIEKIILN